MGTPGDQLIVPSCCPLRRTADATSRRRETLGPLPRCAGAGVGAIRRRPLGQFL